MENNSLPSKENLNIIFDALKETQNLISEILSLQNKTEALQKENNDLRKKLENQEEMKRNIFNYLYPGNHIVDQRKWDHLKHCCDHDYRTYGYDG